MSGTTGPVPLSPSAAAGRLEAARRLGLRPLLVLLERMLGDDGRVGGAASPREEGIRFRHDSRLIFSTADVGSVAERELPGDPEDFTAGPRRVWEVVTTFLGLTGTVSPLPTYLAEEVAQEDQEDGRQREFLDLFHHRAISLFHRAGARCDWPDSHRSDLSDAWSRRVLAWLGLGEVALQRAPGPPWALLRYAPLLAERVLTPQALEAALADALAEDLGGAGVTVEQFAGSWVTIDEADRNRLGRSGATLGQDLVLGRRVFDRTGMYRVVLGPLGRDGFDRLTGSKVPLRRLVDTIGALAAVPLDYQVFLWLSPQAAPRAELSSHGRTRLGRNAWLGGQVRESRVKVELPAA